MRYPKAVFLFFVLALPTRLWAQSPGRIDATHDAYISRANQNTSYCTLTELKVGDPSGNEELVTLIQFSDISTLPPYSTFQWAKLWVKIKSSGNDEVVAGRQTIHGTGWEECYPNWSNSGGDPGDYNPSHVGTTSGAWIYFDISDIVKDYWITNPSTQNQGLTFKSAGTTSWIFYSRESGSSDSPYLEFYPPGPQPGTLSGTILNHLTLQPIAGVSICVTGPTSQCTTSEANGNYSVPNLPVGDYTISCTKSAYLNFTSPFTFEGDQTYNPQMTPHVTITSFSVSPSAINPGDEITVSYYLRNTSSSSQTVWLGASIRLSGTASYNIDDPPNDMSESIPPQSSDYLVQRVFQTQANSTLGPYDIVVGIWRNKVSGSMVENYDRKEQLNALVLQLTSFSDVLIEVDSSPLNDRLPLILIHGWNFNGFPAPPEESVWSRFIDYYNNDDALRGDYKLFYFNYYSNRQFWFRIGETLRDRLDGLSNTDQDFKNSQIVILAHSMGGLIARAFMNSFRSGGPFANMRGGERVNGLITLGTPHHGTPMANGPALQEKIKDLSDIGVFLANFVLFFSPKYDQLNRLDLHWDNFDGLLDYVTFPDESNHSLRAINSDPTFDEKVTTYVGTQEHVVVPLGIYQFGEAVMSSNRLGMASDGMVPTKSASFQNHDISLSHTISGYDHSEIVSGKSSTDTYIFDLLKQDLQRLLVSVDYVYDQLPSRYFLSQNYPNPFNSSTMIKFELPEEAFVSLKLYDILGTQIETLLEGTIQPGTYSIPWYPHDLAGGVYYYRVNSVLFNESKKLLLIK